MVRPPNVEAASADCPQATSGEDSLPAILLEDDHPPRIAVSGAGTKFALGAELESGSTGASGAALPEAYGTGRLILLPRDPHSLYTHWDLNTAQQRAYNRKSSDRHLVVRLHSQGPSGKTEAETHVHPESRHWVLRAPHPGVTYVAELGYYDRQSQWMSVSVSSPATTPPATVASDKTVQFAVIREIPRDAHTPAAAVWPVRTAIEFRLPDTNFVTRGARAFGGQEDTAPTASHENQEIAETCGVDFSSARQNPLSTLPPQVGWIPALETESSLESLPPESVRVRGWSEQQERELGAMLEEMGSTSLSSMEFVSAYSGSFAMGISSPTGPAAVERNFWLQVNAELTIHGGTEPGATVTLDGVPIELRADGTFSCRLALPDGNYAATIVARSRQGELRSARLRFGRSTEADINVGEASATGAPSAKGDIAG